MGGQNAMERESRFWIILLVIDLIISIAMIPIICHHEDMEDIFWISVVMYVVLMVFTIYTLNFGERKHVIGDVILFVIIGSMFFGCTKYDSFTESIRPKEVTDGIEHYELEFWSYDIETETQSNFRSEIIKYKEPILTTVKDMRKDFPIQFETNIKQSIPQQTFDLDEDTKVWVYVTAGVITTEQLQFEYEELDVEPDKINIKTRLKILSRGNPSVGKSIILVVSVIPADQ